MKMSSRDSEDNTYKVCRKQWKKWSPNARDMFEDLYTTMLANQDLYRHPKGPIMHEEHWKTTCWNAAWTAADMYDGRW